jgi:hypothetical protein
MLNAMVEAKKHEEERWAKM